MNDLPDGLERHEFNRAVTDDTPRDPLAAIREAHRVVHRPGVHGTGSWCDEDNVRQPCDTQVVLGVLDATRPSGDEALRAAAELSMDRIARWLFDEDDATNDADLTEAHDALRAALAAAPTPDQETGTGYADYVEHGS